MLLLHPAILGLIATAGLAAAYSNDANQHRRDLAILYSRNALRNGVYAQAPNTFTRRASGVPSNHERRQYRRDARFAMRQTRAVSSRELTARWPGKGGAGNNGGGERDKAGVSAMNVLGDITGGLQAQYHDQKAVQENTEAMVKVRMVAWAKMIYLKDAILELGVTPNSNTVVASDSQHNFKEVMDTVPVLTDLVSLGFVDYVAKTEKDFEVRFGKAKRYVASLQKVQNDLKAKYNIKSWYNGV